MTASVELTEAARRLGYQAAFAPTGQTGLFSFRVRATDTGGCIGEAPYTITILSANIGIPTLGSWMLMLLVALIGVAGAFSVNRFMT